MQPADRGCTVYSGAASDSGRVADVLVRDGSVAAIAAGIEALEGAEVVDTTGCWITPGFVDLHTHYDAELEISPGLTESVRHGITTVLVGSCGLSFAVGTPEDLADQFCRVEGVPRSTVLPLLERVKNWDSPAAYAEHLRNAPIGPNVCTLLGHNAVRAHVMGLGRSVDDTVRPTAKEICAIRRPRHPRDGRRGALPAQVRQRRPVWKLRAVGQGWADGLDGLASALGVDVG